MWLWNDGWPAVVSASAARPEGLVLCVFRETPIVTGTEPLPPPETFDEPALVPRHDDLASPLMSAWRDDRREKEMSRRHLLNRARKSPHTANIRVRRPPPKNRVFSRDLGPHGGQDVTPENRDRPLRRAALRSGAPAAREQTADQSTPPPPGALRRERASVRGRLGDHRLEVVVTLKRRAVGDARPDALRIGEGGRVRSGGPPRNSTCASQTSTMSRTSSPGWWLTAVTYSPLRCAAQ